MPWKNDLSALAIPFLNTNFPPTDWTSNIVQGHPVERGVYFFRLRWWQDYILRHGNHRPRAYPAFHWFASTYAEPNPRYCSTHQIVCATRLEVGLIPEYDHLLPMPPAIDQWFNHDHVPLTTVAWNWPPNVKDIGTFRTLDETIALSRNSYLAFKPVDRVTFDPADQLQDLPADVWQQIQTFFLGDPTVIHFLRIP